MRSYEDFASFVKTEEKKSYSEISKFISDLDSFWPEKAFITHNYILQNTATYGLTKFIGDLIEHDVHILGINGKLQELMCAEVSSSSNEMKNRMELETKLAATRFWKYLHEVVA